MKLNPAIFNSTKFDVITPTRKPRKRKGTHDTHFHIPNDLWDKIKYEAETDYSTFQQVIIRRLYRSYDADER